MRDKILFIDTETGGLDFTKQSLLSVGMVVWSDFQIIDATEILINDGNFRVTSQAMEINKIDLTEHERLGISPAVTIERIDLFLDRHFPSDEKITLAGHNVNFDVNFLRYFLELHNYPWSRRFSHRFVDTASILYFLFLTGKLNEKIVASQDAFDFFSIEIPKRHSALDDAKATAQLFTRLIDLVKR